MQVQVQVEEDEHLGGIDSLVYKAQDDIHWVSEEVDESQTQNESFHQAQSEEVHESWN